MKQLHSSALNNLLEYLHDSQNGYHECKDIVKNQKLSKLFTALSKNRKEMAQEIAEKIKDLSEESTKKGTLTGAAHRLFVNLKSILTERNVDAIINEIKRGENTLIDQYKKVLRDTKFGHIHSLLRNHLEKIEKDLAEIDQLSTVK